MKLFVTLGGRTAEVVVEGDHLTVDGVSYQASLAPVVGTPLYQVIVWDRPLILAARHEGGGRWILQDRGEVVEIAAMDERTRHIAALVGEGKHHVGPTALKAPMPGLVVRILVSKGSPVEAGTGLLVLEAMKMENELKAVGPGVVARVLVQEGQAVEKGQLLVELAAGGPT
jgi:pyruvate carboxylase subunit B